MRHSHVILALLGAVVCAQPALAVPTPVEWQDVSREVVTFADLDELLAASEHLLSAEEIATVKAFILQQGLTPPESIGAGMIHKTRILGVSAEEAARFLVGPATGEGGYAPTFLSATPQNEQIGSDGVLARDAHLPFIPAYFGSDARGVRLSDRVVMTWIQGRAAQGFSVHILSGLPAGLEFTEIGYYVAESRPKSILDFPAVAALLLENTAVGKPFKSLSSRAIAEIHMDKMNVSYSIASRISRGHCRSALDASSTSMRSHVAL